MYISSQEEIRLMIQAADMFVKCDHKAVLFSPDRTKIQKNEKVSRSIMSLFISTMRPFDCDTKIKSEN